MKELEDLWCTIRGIQDYSGSIFNTLIRRVFYKSDERLSGPYISWNNPAFNEDAILLVSQILKDE